MIKKTILNQFYLILQNPTILTTLICIHHSLEPSNDILRKKKIKSTYLGPSQNHIHQLRHKIRRGSWLYELWKLKNSSLLISSLKLKFQHQKLQLKFMYSEKSTGISNFLVFSEYMNLKNLKLHVKDLVFRYRYENLRSTNFRTPKSAFCIIILSCSKTLLCRLTETDFRVLGYVLLKLFNCTYDFYSWVNSKKFEL